MLRCDLRVNELCSTRSLATRLPARAIMAHVDRRAAKPTQRHTQTDPARRAGGVPRHARTRPARSRLDRGELRRVAEHTWRKFLQHGQCTVPEMWPNGSKLALGRVAHRVDYGDPRGGCRDEWLSRD